MLSRLSVRSDVSRMIACLVLAGISIILLLPALWGQFKYLTKGQPQKSESVAAEEFPKEQIAAMMGMACFADSVIAHANDFLEQADTFAQMSREDLRDVLKMLGAINSSIQALGDVVADCSSNS